ncbi:MAG TPA: hypothetical protein PKE39_00670 [Ignavibacteria bacterium]|nr:hypothetical protein [Ignavibacteria bacterium]HMQ97508.1 hypothetical protein [Ignavibacteria bacterium]
MQKLKYILLIIIALLAQNIFSQSGKIVIILKKPPPFLFYTEDMFKLTLINPTNETYRVNLHGRSTETIIGLVIDASCNTFDLPPGTKIVQTSDVGKVTINEKNEKYKDVITRMGQLPSGNYDICVEVVNAATGEILGTDCITQEVMLVSQVALVYPADALKLQTENKYPVFTWLPPVPIAKGQSVTYKLKIVDIYGMQSAYDAMQSNPLYFSNSNIRSTSYQYPVSARPFSAGSSYAWQVEAYLNGNLLSSSEIYDFTYGEMKQVTKTKELATMKKYWGANLDGNFDGNMGGTNLAGKKKTFMFSFNSELFGESANRSGTGSDKEPRYGYLNLTPSVSLYGLPISTSFLFSSENSASRQNINSAGLNLDVSTIKEFISERIDQEKNKILSENNKNESELSEKQKDKLENDAKYKVMSKMSPALKLISSFKTLGIGTTYPSYTPFTMQGVPVSGLNVEFNPGWFYIAATAQKNQKPIDNTSFRRDLYSGRIGYGQSDKSHIYLTGLYANDKAGSILVDSSNQLLTPNSNYLFGIQGKLNLFRDKLSFEAEAVGSMLTRDNRDADLENKSIPSFVKNMFHPKISSQIDYSYTIKSVFDNQKSNTKVTASLKMVGPGFVTLGNPTLRGDKMEVETKISQKFVNKQVSVTASLKWFRDNLISSKRYTTNTTIPNLTVNLNFKGYPYVMLAYMPNFMTNDATDPVYKFDYKNHLLMVNTGHSIRFGKMNLSSNLSYMFNQATSLDTASGYTSNSFTLSEGLSFDIPLSLSASVNVIHSDYVNDYSRILSFDAFASYTLEDVWTNMIGFSTGVEKDKNRKRMFYLTTSFSIIQNVNFEIRTEKNLFTDWATSSNNFDEFLIRGTVTTNW